MLDAFPKLAMLFTQPLFILQPTSGKKATQRKAIREKILLVCTKNTAATFPIYTLQLLQHTSELFVLYVELFKHYWSLAVPGPPGPLT